MRIGNLQRLVGAVVLTALAAPPGAAAPRANREGPLRFHDARARAPQFIAYYKSISLTPAQEKIKSEALSALPAPCCRDYPLMTCCCPCNLAKSVWGLSHYLIAKRGYTAPKVKQAVQKWLGFINPNGFTGDACFTGGCKRPFAENGCGGMDEKRVLTGAERRGGA